MHVLDDNCALPQFSNWWSLGSVDLEQLALAMLGPLPGGWVRTGENYVRVGGVKYGSDARRLSAELVALSAAARQVLGGATPESTLRAAAFYHLRFENVHPLCEGNGRVGRMILACQLRQALGVPVRDTLRGLHDWESDYHRLFTTADPNVMFELLLDILQRVTGIPLGPDDLRLPASIEPLHPQRSIPKDARRLHPEQVMGRSPPDQRLHFAPRQVPPPTHR